MQKYLNERTDFLRMAGVGAVRPDVFEEYAELMREQTVFNEAFREYVRGSASKFETLMHLLDSTFEFLSELGLANQHDVYAAVKRQGHNNFCSTGVWKVCHVSGIPSRDCLQLDDTVFVHRAYTKWVQCLWLTTHAREQEQMRSLRDAVPDIPPAHAEIYRLAVLFVLEHLNGLYRTAAEITKKQSA
jgi:hypothetical protein